MLHLRCGDDILPALEAAGLPGRRAQWADPLCQGPLAPWADDWDRRRERAAWLAGRYSRPEAEVLADLEAADAVLDTAAAEDEVVLWFEHDLFDQAILVFLLVQLADRAPDRTRLICIGSHPEVPGFTGLGNLTPSQLGELFPTRHRVGPEEFAAAAQAWQAMTGGDPEALWALAVRDGSPLPFLPRALRRYLPELPSVRNGLGLTESLALQAIAAGADRARHAFITAQRFEADPWLGDAMFFAILQRLTEGPAPLLRAEPRRLPPPGDPTFGAVVLELTAEGRAVLTGRADWCALSGRSWRLGSIPVDGPDPAWRWDERAERPVRRDQAPDGTR